MSSVEESGVELEELVRRRVQYSTAVVAVAVVPAFGCCWVLAAEGIENEGGFDTGSLVCRDMDGATV